MKQKKKIALSWSGGKDAALTYLYLNRSEEYEVAVLLSTFHQNTGRSSMHGHSYELIKRQAEAMQIPLLDIWIQEEGINSYEKAMNNGVNKLKQNFSVSAVAFGDLFLEDIREYREEQMAKTGLDCLFPIWKVPTKQAAQEIIEQNIETRICCVTDPTISKELIARKYDQAFLDELPEQVDPCGENGEFHSFVYNAPFFTNPISIKTGESFFVAVPEQFRQNHGIQGHWYIDILSE